MIYKKSLYCLYKRPKVFWYPDLKSDNSYLFTLEWRKYFWVFQNFGSCIERIPRFSFVYEQKRLTLPISQNKIIWVLFTGRKNAIHELIFQNFFFILFLVGKSCVTHDISVVILNLSNWMDPHTVNIYIKIRQWKKLSISSWNEFFTAKYNIFEFYFWIRKYKPSLLLWPWIKVLPK